MTIAAAQLGMIGASDPRSSQTKSPVPPVKPGTNKSFAPLKQIDAGLLTFGYAKRVPPTALQSFCFAPGPMTFTAAPMSLR